MEVTKVSNATRVFKIGEVETKALRGVNLSIKDGEFTALVGLRVQARPHCFSSLVRSTSLRQAM